MANNSTKDNSKQTRKNFVHDYFRTRLNILNKYCDTSPHRDTLSKADILLTHQQSVVKNCDARLLPYHCHNQETVPQLDIHNALFSEVGSSSIVQEYRRPRYEDLEPLPVENRLERIADEAFFRMLVAYKENRMDRLTDDFMKIFKKFNIFPFSTGTITVVPSAYHPAIVAKPATHSCNVYPANTVMVAIGDGYTEVPASVLNNMDWTLHTNCTRKLLTTIFPRSVLATHSLPPKQSLAITEKPNAKVLNPLLINDIIKIVMEKCGVTENQVRISIASKCADESKMFRTRVQRSKSVDKQASSVDKQASSVDKQANSVDKQANSVDKQANSVDKQASDLQKANDIEEL